MLCIWHEYKEYKHLLGHGIQVCMLTLTLAHELAQGYVNLDMIQVQF